MSVADELGSIDGSGLTSPNVVLTADLGNVDVAFRAPPDQVIATDQQGNVTVTVPDTTAYQVRTPCTARPSDGQRAPLGQRGSRH
jgi:hypothetical protein